MITKEREEELRRDAAKTADKYIKSDWKSTEAKSRITENQLNDLVNVASFILYQPDNAIWGAVRKSEAIKSLARIFKLTVPELTQAIMNPKTRTRR